VEGYEGRDEYSSREEADDGGFGGFDSLEEGEFVFFFFGVVVVVIIVAAAAGGERCVLISAC